MTAPTENDIRLPIYNFYEVVRHEPDRYRQLVYNDLLMSEFTCPLEGKFQAMWSHYNYFVYVLEGRKIWHTPGASFDLRQGSCVFVRKGACIVEQFFDARFCILLFFLPDDFICETLRPRAGRIPPAETPAQAILPVHTDVSLVAYMQSMLPYFSRESHPDKSLIELKFRELLLNIADNGNNRDLLAYFCALLHEPAAISLQQMMEDNFAYNLKLEAYAQLCNRSLSAFKRDFQKIYGTTPGKWLLERRLTQAHMLLRNSKKSVSDAAYDSGFENISHFSRAFRARFGASPASFRQKWMETPGLDFSAK